MKAPEELRQLAKQWQDEERRIYDSREFGSFRASIAANRVAQGLFTLAVYYETQEKKKSYEY